MVKQDAVVFELQWVFHVQFMNQVRCPGLEKVDVGWLRLEGSEPWSGKKFVRDDEKARGCKFQVTYSSQLCQALCWEVEIVEQNWAQTGVIIRTQELIQRRWVCESRGALTCCKRNALFEDTFKPWSKVLFSFGSSVRGGNDGWMAGHWLVTEVLWPNGQPISENPSRRNWKEDVSTGKKNF